MNAKVKVLLGIAAAAFLVAGVFQGLGLAGISSEPTIQGYFGGVFPVLAGAVGTLCLERAFS
jgi:hypothetical protein